MDRKFSSTLNIKTLSRRGLGGIIAENQKYFLSLGDIYHQIEKTNETQISVKIHKPKKKSNIPPIAKEYRYVLRPYLGSQEDSIQCKTSFAAREKTIDLKWNTFDQYVTSVDTDEDREDEEEGDSMKSWSSRYVILPRSDMFFPNESTLSETLDDPGIIHNFYNILFLMNNLKGQDIVPEKRKGLDLNVPPHNSSMTSSSASLPSSPLHHPQPSFCSAENTDLLHLLESDSRPRTLTSLNLDKLTTMNSLPTGESSFPPEIEHKLTPSLPSALNSQPGSFLSKLFPKTGTNTSQPLKNLIEEMTNPECGNQMSFLKILKKGQLNQILLPDNTFLSSLLVDWLFRQVDDVETRTQAIEIGQQMLKKNLIERVDKSYDRAVDKSGTQIFFDGFYLYNIASKATKNKPKLEINFEIAVPLGTNHVSRIDDFCPNEDVVIKIQGRQKEQGRYERFNICHHTCFDPRHAFELLVDWKVATGKLIEENYLLKWKDKAKKSGFNFVCVPQNPFTGPEMMVPDDLNITQSPFRAYIKVVIECSNFYEIEAAIQQFGFLRDFPAGNVYTGKELNTNFKNNKDNNYVHHTGFCFVQINVGLINSTIRWAFNPLLGSKKWQPFLPTDDKSKYSKNGNESLKFSQKMLDMFMNHVKSRFHVTQDSD